MDMIYALSLHDALPILVDRLMEDQKGSTNMAYVKIPFDKAQSGNEPVSEKQILDFMKKHKNEFRSEEHTSDSSHVAISYAVFCLKKKKHSESECRLTQQ